jgi:hypothetical protein
MVRATSASGQSLPAIDFEAEDENCPLCGGELRVQKTKRRKVVTLDQGPIEAREIRKRCRQNSCAPLVSRALTQLVKPGQKYAYDLVVHVGLSRYMAGLQREEIRRLLRNDHGIELSAGSVSALCDRFVGYLEMLHVARAPVLRQALDGGYPMHIDATCERGKGGLFVCIDGWRNWVLWAARVPSESGDNLTPVIEKAVSLFGHPIATVRDMGEGCAHSVGALRKAGIPDLICHYHFLAAVGRKLFGHLYEALKGMLRLAHCRSDMRVIFKELREYSPTEKTDGCYGKGTVRDALKALVLWVLEGDGSSDAPFPFSLPHYEFSRRCLQVGQRAEPWVCRPRSLPERRAMARLERIVARLERDPRFVPTMDELESRWAAFCELRDVLRLSNAELPRGDGRPTQKHLPALELLRLRQIKLAVDEYTIDLEGRLSEKEKELKKPKSTAGIILRYLRRHATSLFGHPAKYNDDGQVIAVVERTNNIAEQFFGQQKQQLRRRVGRCQLGRDLEKQPAQVALTANLRDPEYVRLLCGTLDDLPAAFALLDQGTSTEMPLLIRDHRDSHLQRVLRQLLDKPVHPRSNNDDERRSPPILPTPLKEEIVAAVQELEEPSAEQIQKSISPAIALPPEPPRKPRDPRWPPPGSVLERWIGRRAYRVEVLEDGFLWADKTYATPTQLAQAITKTSRNGYDFFGLTMPWPQRAERLRGRRINRFTMIDLPSATES